MKKLVILFSVLISTTACEKGSRGPQGPPGPAGLDANLNSFVITVASQDWVSVGDFGTSNFAFTATYSAPELTPNVVDFGLVQVYVSSEFGWAALPYTLMEGAYETNVNFAYDYDLITFIVKDSDLQTQRFASSIDFKVVVAPDGIGKVEFEKALKEFEKQGLQSL